MQTWVEKLIDEYSVGKKELEKLREKLDLSTDEGINDYQLIGGMIGDMQYALEWMKKGRRPGNLRGVEKRSAYQRRALLDMDLFPSWDIEVKPRELSEIEKKAIVDVLIDLSYRERQCYLLHMGQGWSLSEIAKELNISKRSVQQYVDRAKQKIKNKVS